MPRDFLKERPLDGENPSAFAARMVDLGCREGECRKAVRNQFLLSLPEAVEICGRFRIARVREVQAEILKRPGRTHYSMVRWTCRTFHISEEEAAALVNEAVELRSSLENEGND